MVRLESGVSVKQTSHILLSVTITTLLAVELSKLHGVILQRNSLDIPITDSRRIFQGQTKWVLYLQLPSFIYSVEGVEVYNFVSLVY